MRIMECKVDFPLILVDIQIGTMRGIIDPQKPPSMLTLFSHLGKAGLPAIDYVNCMTREDWPSTLKHGFSMEARTGLA
jgi:hypothetical protein